MKAMQGKLGRACPTMLRASIARTAPHVSGSRHFGNQKGLKKKEFEKMFGVDYSARLKNRLRVPLRRWEEQVEDILIKMRGDENKIVRPKKYQKIHRGPRVILKQRLDANYEEKLAQLQRANDKELDRRRGELHTFYGDRTGV